jgi:uncharacterized protein
VIVGDMPMSGRRSLRGFLQLNKALNEKYFAAGPFTMSIGTVTAENERVLLEAESRVTLKSGEIYNNQYIWAMTVEDGRVVELKEILDTLHMYRLLDGEETRGIGEERTNNLFSVPSEVVEGRIASS